MTATDEARAREIVDTVAEQHRLAGSRGWGDALRGAITAAISEARDQGANDVCRQIRQATATKDEARDLLFGPMGLNYSLMNGYHDIAVEDLAFVLESQRHKEPMVSLPVAAPAIAPLREEVVRLALKAATLRGQSKAEHRRACVARDKACAALAATQEPTP